jgi:thiosulfate/3-mercaptopyruvate sulfurtransferase
VVDVRTPREYSGEDIRAVRGGHIPGAVSIPYEQNWKDPSTAAKLAAGQAKDRSGMALKSPDELKGLYARLDPSKETVVYCQSGRRASETAAVLRSIGFSDVKVYESSWLGYAGALAAPVENEVFVNVGSLKDQITALQKRVADLEAELAKLRTPVEH